MTARSVYDHVEPTDVGHPPGVYRVVGTGDEAVTLLRVGDADGRRVHSGEIVRVGHDDLSAFVPAENPDGNRSLRAVADSALTAAYWSVRTFARRLIAHPVATVGALAVLGAGLVGEHVLPVPEIAFSGLTLVGGLGLAYIGSGRL